MPSFDMVDLQVMCIGCIGAAAAILSGGGGCRGGEGLPGAQRPRHKGGRNCGFSERSHVWILSWWRLPRIVRRQDLLIQRPTHNAGGVMQI